MLCCTAICQRTKFLNDLKHIMPEIEDTKSANYKSAALYLTFKDDIGPSLVNLKNISSDQGIVYEAARIFRDKMLSHESNASDVIESNDGSVNIPPLLLQFISILLHGSGMADTNDNSFKIDASLSQLLQFNCFGKTSGHGSYLRHDKSRETFHPCVYWSNIIL